jgi:hypothetical protein
MSKLFSSDNVSGLVVFGVIAYGGWAYMNSIDGVKSLYGEQFMAAYGECLKRNEKAIAAEGMRKGVEFCVRKDSFDLSGFVKVEDYVIPHQNDKMGPRLIVRNTSTSYAVSMLNITLLDQPSGISSQTVFVGSIKPGATGQVFFSHGTKVDRVRYNVTEALGFPYDASPPKFH